jgi:hypothetical protein
MNTKYLLAVQGAALKHMPKQFLLKIERTIVAGAGVNPDLANISGFRKILFPQRNLTGPFLD